mmetsp:Transcript_51239/g.133043  ORF Transcript_51239/g.133043 Transcript_51239/m.133043 type:complete len:284 (-) Transcript_51239:218-1069(-)|eukprot:CAMPEP_0115861882 /NCGR_PEP_ID=MMETSP0287-20121206/17887_1 /TAXON_ID=412157 /ORGANISM="Chrysochromulina rotalis, Strain UIO044" /LENGTH=283 /DNA_ID=CAMNT_0003316281 /DNA_START=28 /DNA_END=879 /DNA_ORIENTATION=+
MAAPLTAAADFNTEQNIATKKKSRARRQNITGELANLSEKFAPIYGEVQDGVTAEYEKQEDSLKSVEDHILRIQRTILQEQIRRVDMYKSVQSNLEQQYDTVEEQCAVQIEALRPEVPARLVAWHERLDDGFKFVADEAIARMHVIVREKLRLLKMVDDFEKQLDLEKVERLNRETYLHQNLSEEMTVVNEAVDAERSRRELTLGHVRDENEQIDAMRDKPYTIFKDDMVKRMVKATVNIRQATAKRVYAEQQFVNALESYTKSLQTGLRMVNKKPPQQLAGF